MGRRSEAREVVYVERASDSSAKWLFWGALLGAGVALLYAPRSGEETRRGLQRRLWKLRAMTEEKFDEFAQQFGGGKDAIDDQMDDDELDDSGELPPARPRAGSVATAREELERRLAESRARRRSVSDNEEPPA